MKTASVLGCGWLGLPVALALAKAGFSVRGSSRDPERLREISEKGIEPYLIDLDPGISKENSENARAFLSSDVLFVNFPPPRRNDVEAWHPLQIKSLLEAMPEPQGKWIIFASSTSVYPNTNGLVREDDGWVPEKPSGKALLKVESILSEHLEIDATVIRFAGLVGYDRSPMNSVKRKKLVLNPDCTLNLIHRDDCVGIVMRVIELDARNVTLNASCDNHPTRREYYSREADMCGVESPAFESNMNLEYKIVSNEKLKKTLGYRLIYPDPLEITEKEKERSENLSGTS